MAGLSASCRETDKLCAEKITYFLRMPKKVLNLDTSLWGSSVVSAESTVGGAGGTDDAVDMIRVSLRRPAGSFQRRLRDAAVRADS